MAASDLATLADVKAWLAGSSGIGSSDDALISRLITDVSGAITAYLSRPSLIARTLTERYDGGGKRRLYLRQFPVISIALLLVNDVAVPAAPQPQGGGSWPQAGYLLDPWDGVPPGRIQALDLFGDWSLGQSYNAFHPGRQNVVVTYTAGYQVSAEAATVPGTPYEITMQAPYGPWASDGGVTYAAGGALTKISATPSLGQYAVAAGVYTFAAADTGAGVLISYGFIPAAINNACIEWVAERYRYRTRIGQSAQTVQGQQTASYSLKDVPDFIRASLDPYRSVAAV
jgi:hypothetical protein